MSQTASGGWDRGLVSLYQFLRPLPLSPSKPAPGCPPTLPPSGASPRPASVRWAPLKGRWPQVQVGSRSPQLGLQAWTGNCGVSSGSSTASLPSAPGSLARSAFSRERIRGVCPRIASLTQHLARQVHPGIAHPRTACLQRLNHSHCGQTRFSFLFICKGHLDCSHSWAFVNMMHWGADISTRSRFHFLWINTQMWINTQTRTAQSYGSSLL